MLFSVTQPLGLAWQADDISNASRIASIANALQAGMERAAPRLEAKVKTSKTAGGDPCLIVTAKVEAEYELAAAEKLRYWMKKAIGRQRDLRWNARLVDVAQATVKPARKAKVAA